MTARFDRRTARLLELLRQRPRIGKPVQRLGRGLNRAPRILARLFEAPDLGLDACEPCRTLRNRACGERRPTLRREEVVLALAQFTGSRRDTASMAAVCSACAAACSACA